MKKGWMILISAVLLIASVIGIYAFYTSKESIANIFKVGEIKINVDEEFTSPDNWDGGKYDKIVKIENLSTVDAFIRAAIVPRWVDEKGKDWAGDNSFIEINYTNIVDVQSDAKGWVNGKDGYYYYNQKMPATDGIKANETTLLIDSVTANIPEELQKRYSGKKLIVEVKSEAVQAASGAYEKSWTTAPQEIKNMFKNLAK